MRILVIEDDVKVGRLLQQILGEEGYEVEWAQDGQEAIWMGLEVHYDLILLDHENAHTRPSVRALRILFSP